MRPLSPILEHKNNNFTLIRLIAALLVVYGHAFALFPSNGHTDIFSQLSHFTNSGALGVNTFFFLSGMFVTASFDKLKNPVSFVVRRVLRLVPALFVCVTITVLIIGPIVTQTSLKNYFTSPLTWQYEVFNVSVIKTMHELPGVFIKNYWPNDVNGSLYTLALEVKCYLLVLLLGILNVFKKQTYTILAIPLIFLFYFIPFAPLKIFLSRMEFMLFMTGSLAYVLRDKIMIDYRIAIGLVVATAIIAKFFHPWFEFPFWVTIVYLVVMLGSSGFAKKIKLPGDFSYGIYIYSFLIQQLLNYYYPRTTSYQSFLVVLPVVILLSMASWYLIEKRAIDLGHRLFKTRTAVPVRV